MNIYKNEGTGISTPQGRVCNAFSFDLRIKSHTQHLVFEVWFYEVDEDAIHSKKPNNIRNITIPITTETTFEECVESLFSGSPYDLNNETIDLSNAEVIGTYPK